MDNINKKVKVVKARADVKIGEFIWADMLIPNNLVEPGALGGSRTTKAINRGDKVKKMARVIGLKPHCLVVHYATTFHGKPLKDVVLRPDEWEEDPRGRGWICTGAKIEVDAEEVEVLVYPKHDISELEKPDQTGDP